MKEAAGQKKTRDMRDRVIEEEDPKSTAEVGCATHNSTEPRAAVPHGCKGHALAVANFSSQRILPVSCITRNNVRMEPIVTLKPVKPLKKNA